MCVPTRTAQGEDTGEDWFIEHVMGELDAPNEFFYDAAAGKLYFYYNASTSECLRAVGGRLHGTNLTAHQ